MIFLSPAKINIFLRVLRRRDDGYHDLASLFQAVDLCDTLEFSFAPCDQITCSDPLIPCDGSNLICKALALFREKTGLCTPLKVHLDKKIPIQAGLGGGSSNAATTLFALNAMHKTALSNSVLTDWAALLGSDVPFFFSKGRAFCTGRGENVEELEAMQSQKSLWVVKPDEGLSTPLIFKLLNMANCSTEDPRELLQKNAHDIYLYNDLEEAAFCALPSLKNVKNELLSQGFESVGLTGSGAGLICVGHNRPQLPSSFKCYPLKFLERGVHNWYHGPVFSERTS